MTVQPHYKIVFLACFLVLSLLGLGLLTSRDTQAHPQYGLTPTTTPSMAPTTPPPPTVTKPSNGNGDDSFIDIQCDLTCSVDQVAEVRAKIELIHEGSGWIAEATLSNLHSTRVRVPYPGQWKVWLVSPPEFTSAPGNPAGDPQFEIAYPTNLPALLGVVEANSGVQTVDCPLSCLEIEIPPDLPTTGRKGITPSQILLAMNLILVLVLAGSVIIHRYRVPKV